MSMIIKNKKLYLGIKLVVRQKNIVLFLLPNNKNIVVFSDGIPKF